MKAAYALTLCALPASILLTGGCGGGSSSVPTPTATPTTTPGATATTTPLPTVTATSAPTSTPRPTATTQPTATPTATATPISPDLNFTSFSTVGYATDGTPELAVYDSKGYSDNLSSLTVIWRKRPFAAGLRRILPISSVQIIYARYPSQVWRAVSGTAILERYTPGTIDPSFPSNAELAFRLKNVRMEAETGTGAVGYFVIEDKLIKADNGIVN